MTISTSVWNGLALTRPHQDPPAGPPLLSPIGDRSVEEGSELVFTAAATDPDAGQTLTYSLTEAPAGAAIDPTTGAFRWTPTEEQGPGTHPVTVRVSDGTLFDEERITLTVAEVNRVDRVVVGRHTLIRPTVTPWIGAATVVDARLQPNSRWAQGVRRTLRPVR